MNLVDNLHEVYKVMVERASAIKKDFPVLNPANQCSRDNLLCYAVLRGFDTHELQGELAERGLSSLGNLEVSVLHSMGQVLGYLGVQVEHGDFCTPTIAGARRIVEERSVTLFGRPRRERNTRIMVTLDPSYLGQEGLLEQLLLSGMDIARINCAHHTRTEWQQMIEALRIAEAKLAATGRGVGRKCHIVMDIGGPKIRTGNFELDTQPIKISVPDPTQWLEGFINSKTLFTEVGSDTKGQESFVLAVNLDADFSRLETGDKLYFYDVMEKRRVLHILEKIDNHTLRVAIRRTARIHNNTVIHSKKDQKFYIRSVKPRAVRLECCAGDSIRLYRQKHRLGHAGCENTSIGLSCTTPEVLDFVNVGERVYIDDGKISCVIQEIQEDYITLRVAAPSERHVRIREHKGLNFPDSNIRMPALTKEDRENLEFIAKYATAINYSFVQEPQDIYDLHQALLELDAGHIGIIAKIETKQAIYNLTRILVAGLEMPSFGIMVARGDLAVEVGFEALPFVQEDILDLCDAAHIPVVLATQYLETLAKKGMPARGEIIDAAMAQRAECVMLNKGKHITNAVETLGHVIASQELRHRKKRQVYKRFTKQNGIFDE